MIAKLVVPLAACAYLLGHSAGEARSFKCLANDARGLAFEVMGEFDPDGTTLKRGNLYLAGRRMPAASTELPPELGTPARPRVFAPDAWFTHWSDRDGLRIHAGSGSDLTVDIVHAAAPAPRVTSDVQTTPRKFSTRSLDARDGVVPGLADVRQWPAD